MQFKDYYKILGVEPKASSKEIKTAYRKLARKYHPDLSDHQDAEERFKEIAEAYEVLKNTERRTEFDEIRQYGTHGQTFTPPPGWQPGGAEGFHTADTGGFSDFFSSIFGQGFSEAGVDGTHSNRKHKSYYDERVFNRGQDIETELPVFLEDTLKDTPKTISYQLAGINRTLNVTIPAGVANGERIRLKGQGGLGFDNGDNGDLYLRIRLVPHPLFDIEGHNLIVVLPLSPWEAALGTKVDIPTLSGKVRMTIPANSQSGQRLRLKGKGLPNKQGGHGDLYAVIKIVMPIRNDQKTEALWQQLAEKHSFDPRKEWSK